MVCLIITCLFCVRVFASFQGAFRRAGRFKIGFKIGLKIGSRKGSGITGDFDHV